MFFEKIKLIMNGVESELEDIEYFRNNMVEKSKEYKCENNKMNRLGVEIMLVLFFANVFAIYYFVNAKEVSVLNYLFLDVNFIGFCSLIAVFVMYGIFDVFLYLKSFVFFVKKIFKKKQL